MKKPANPANEQERIAVLQSLNILDTAGEERFDRITRLAKSLFNVPIALVSLVDTDRQWFKSKQGLDTDETPRDISFCGHTILQPDLFIINNALTDERFADNPLVTDEPNIRFYIGYPLTIGNECRLGTLNLIDSKPREFNEEQQSLMYDLGKMVEDELKGWQDAITCELTGLTNRRGFNQLAQYTLELSKRFQEPVGLFVIDMNDFKSINDTYGHSEGDSALKQFSSVLLKTFRHSDVIARVGGDEFVVLTSKTYPQHIDLIKQRLRNAVDTYNQESGKPYELCYSIGEASFEPENPLSLDTLFEVADRNMFANKDESKKALKNIIITSC